MVTCHPVEALLSQHGKLFEDGLGTLQGYEAKLYVDPQAIPKFCKARPVPYAMRGKVEEVTGEPGVVSRLQESQEYPLFLVGDDTKVQKPLEVTVQVHGWTPISDGGGHWSISVFDIAQDLPAALAKSSLESLISQPSYTDWYKKGSWNPYNLLTGQHQLCQCGRKTRVSSCVWRLQIDS